VSEAVNLYDLALQADPADPPGYRDRSAAAGPAIGAELLGASVYEIDPGESVNPYHYEGVEEEWLLVLAGTPILRDPDGEHQLVAGDVVAFPAGPAGAHKVSNRSDGAVRIVMLSTIPRNEISICVYPDSGKVGVWPPGLRLRITESVDYWDGEV
jgi:uncharacterized cupin superfamily protein